MKKKGSRAHLFCSPTTPTAFRARSLRFAWRKWCRGAATTRITTTKINKNCLQRFGTFSFSLLEFLLQEKENFLFSFSSIFFFGFEEEFEAVPAVVACTQQQRRQERTNECTDVYDVCL